MVSFRDTPFSVIFYLKKRQKQKSGLPFAVKLKVQTISINANGDRLR